MVYFFHPCPLQHLKTSAQALDAVVSCTIILHLHNIIVLISVLFLQNMLVLLPLLNIIDLAQHSRSCITFLFLHN